MNPISKYNNFSKKCLRLFYICQQKKRQKMSLFGWNFDLGGKFVSKMTSQHSQTIHFWKAEGLIFHLSYSNIIYIGMGTLHNVFTKVKHRTHSFLEMGHTGLQITGRLRRKPAGITISPTERSWEMPAGIFNFYLWRHKEDIGLW